MNLNVGDVVVWKETFRRSREDIIKRCTVAIIVSARSTFGADVVSVVMLLDDLRRLETSFFKDNVDDWLEVVR